MFASFPKYRLNNHITIFHVIHAIIVRQANPPYLLSTIQYVNAFIGNELHGEDHYWWTQFSAAVTFIKTMDYTH